MLLLIYGIQVDKFNIEMNGLNMHKEQIQLYLQLILLMFFNKKDRIKTAKYELHKMLDLKQL